MLVAGLRDLARAGGGAGCDGTGSTSGSSTRAAAWASRMPTTRPPARRRRAGGGARGRAATWAARAALRDARVLLRARALAGRAGRRLPRTGRAHQGPRRARTSRSWTAASITCCVRALVGEQQRVVPVGVAAQGVARRRMRSRRCRRARSAPAWTCWPPTCRCPCRAPATSTRSWTPAPTASASRCRFFLSHPIPAEVAIEGRRRPHLPPAASSPPERPLSRLGIRRPAATTAGASGFRHAVGSPSAADAQPLGGRASSACTRRGAVPPMTSGRASALSSSAAARSAPGTPASVRQRGRHARPRTRRGPPRCPHRRDPSAPRRPLPRGPPASPRCDVPRGRARRAPRARRRRRWRW